MLILDLAIWVMAAMGVGDGKRGWWRNGGGHWGRQDPRGTGTRAWLLHEGSTWIHSKRAPADEGMCCAIRLDPFSGTLDPMLVSQNSAARDDGDGGDRKLRRRRAERALAAGGTCAAGELNVRRRRAVWPRVEGVSRGKDSCAGCSAARDAVPREVWRGIDLAFCITVGDHPILALPFSFGGLQFAKNA